MSRLEQTLNKPKVVLVVGVVAVALNVLLYFGYFLPRMTPLIAHINPIGTSLPEVFVPDEGAKSDSETGSKAAPESNSKSDPEGSGELNLGAGGGSGSESYVESYVEAVSGSASASSSASPSASSSDSSAGSPPPQQQSSSPPEPPPLPEASHHFVRRTRHLQRRPRLRTRSINKLRRQGRGFEAMCLSIAGMVYYSPLVRNGVGVPSSFLPPR